MVSPARLPASPGRRWRVDNFNHLHRVETGDFLDGLPSYSYNVNMHVRRTWKSWHRWENWYISWPDLQTNVFNPLDLLTYSWAYLDVSQSQLSTDCYLPLPSFCILELKKRFRDSFRIVRLLFCVCATLVLKQMTFFCVWNAEHFTGNNGEKSGTQPIILHFARNKFFFSFAKRNNLWKTINAM